MTRWDAFADVCGYLRAGLLAGKPPRRRRNREWVLLIETSSFHFVTPSLAGCLKDELNLPHEIREYLDAVLTFNGRRNALMLETLSRIVAALNAIDIEPVLMKGCARLVEGEYPEPNMRFLGDLDILVPTNRATDAYAALVANGFYEKTGEAYPPDHHHLHVLIDNNTGAGVEIHREVSPGFCPQVLLTSWFCEGSRPFRLQDNLHVRLPDQTRSAGHNIVHDQFHHGGYQNCTIELRQLLDLALIRKRHEAAIDWAELDHFFVEWALVRCSRPICNFAKSCWDRRRLDSAAAPASVRLSAFARLSIRQNHRNLPKPQPLLRANLLQSQPLLP
jgi:hypothetical protein